VGDDLTLAYSTRWDSVAGSLALAAGGDSVLVYCRNENEIIFLGGLLYSGTSWLDDNANANSDNELYGTDQSSLPASLINANTALPHLDNYVYQGIHSGSKKNCKQRFKTLTIGAVPIRNVNFLRNPSLQ
jgi:hypothetical protein